MNILGNLRKPFFIRSFAVLNKMYERDVVSIWRGSLNILRFRPGGGLTGLESQRSGGP